MPEFANEAEVTTLQSVQQCIASIAKVSPEDMPTSMPLNWIEEWNTALSEKGVQLVQENPSVSVQAMHIGLFNDKGNLYAAVFQRDKVISNPSNRPVSKGRLIARLRVEMAKEEAGDGEEE